jgi:pimeloyl-ACP methyl ester carboxylesterase
VQLLHGEPGSVLIWAALEPMLRARGFDVQIGDRNERLRPVGRPPVPTVIVGHGFGAAGAVARAANAPERTRALVLVAPALRSGRVPVADRILAAPIIGPAVAGLVLRALGRTRLRPLLADRVGLTPTQIEHLGYTPSRRQIWRRFVVEQRRLVSEARSLRRLLGQVRCPTFVIAGQHDRMVSFADASALVSRLPRCTFTTTDTGHLIPIDDPGAVLSAVLRAHQAP